MRDGGGGGFTAAGVIGLGPKKVDQVRFGSLFPGSRSDYQKNGLYFRGPDFGNFLKPSAGQHIVSLDF